MKSESEYRGLLSDAAERAIRYLDQISFRHVFPTAEALDDMTRLGGTLPDRGEEPSSVLNLLDAFGSPATVASTGGRYFGFVVGGAIPASVAAHWLADAWDQNASMYALSPVAAYLEEVALKWIIDLVKLPAKSGGAFVTGGQMANFTCLAAARHAVLERVGWDVEKDGLFGAPPITVILCEDTHATVFKALALLGLGRNRIVAVPSDSQGRLHADGLPKIEGPTIVCTQAGNVNTGAFDPVQEISAAVRSSGAWVHVDGAFGLWAAAAPNRRDLVAGIAAADSWAMDGHKWLNVPQDSGIAVVRNPSDLQTAMAISAAYLHASEHREPMHWGPESSRRARGIEIWTALRTLGREGIADLVERCCRYAVQVAERIKAAGYEILNDVVLNQVLVSFGDSETTERVIKGIQSDGTCWCGGTTWHGRPAMRISISSWATTENDIDRSVDAILKVAVAETSRE